MDPDNTITQDRDVQLAFAAAVRDAMGRLNEAITKAAEVGVQVELRPFGHTETPGIASSKWKCFCTIET